MHKVFIRDIIAIEREVILPDRCPRCKTDFGKGTTKIKLWSLRPIFHDVQLGTTKECGVDIDVFTTTLSSTPLPVDGGDWDRLPAIFKCASCGCTLAKYRRRTWILEALPKFLAERLEKLLYEKDDNDPMVQQKVFGAE